MFEYGNIENVEKQVPPRSLGNVAVAGGILGLFKNKGKKYAGGNGSAYNPKQAKSFIVIHNFVLSVWRLR